MNMDLIISRSCGFALLFTTGRPEKNPYADVQIRLFVLKAGLPHQPLCCELDHVNLQLGPIYEAVSYTWTDEKGDDSVCRTIRCGPDDEVIGITRNCETALLRLRRRNVDRRLWVDAVCIDQSQVEERNHQVKNMMAIFRSALRVVVFLGDESPVIGRLVDYMSNDSGGQLPSVLDFISLFQSRWFHRLWVLQEVAVAKSVLVVYGEHQMSWVDLVEHSKLFLRLIATRNLRLALPPIVSYGLRQTRLPRLTGVLQKSDLLSLLQVSRNCSCKDPRDKVYAIMGLLKDESPLPLRVDYSLPATAASVFLQAAAWHIHTTKTLEILAHVGGVSEMPVRSWVPDWTRRSPVILPAQFKLPKEFFPPQITSIDGQALYPGPTLNYPLDCVIRVIGRKYRTIFREDPFRKSMQNYWLHWLLNPSPNPGVRRCEETRLFWKGLFSPSDTLMDHCRYYPDIPPAFGKFYTAQCAAEDVIGQLVTEGAIMRSMAAIIERTLNRAIVASDIRDDIKQNAEKVIETSIKLSIIPATRMVGSYVNKVLQSSLGHFNKYELEKFKKIRTSHGIDSRVFGTDHSLGFGPVDLQDKDEVWVLDGATVPFLLRPQGRHYYTLAGACYLHQANRTADRCANYACETARTEGISPQQEINIL
ncbi:Heterokaryon incompatibility protein (HET) domain containing protein [Rhypophila decipiens]